MYVIPDGMTEAEVLEKLERAVRLLSHNFVFAYWDLDDIRQEARRFGLEALSRYDPGGYGPDGEPNRKLENFLFSHVKNRLINLVRDKYRRNDPPCGLCHRGRQAEHADGRVCEKYRAWRARNNAKANLARPLALGGVPAERERNTRADADVEAKAALAEAVRLIDEKLPAELRSDYLRMRAGEAIPKSRRYRVEAAIKELLGGGEEEGAAEPGRA